MILVACIVGAYFMGAIPIGYLVARARGVDLFKVGSGNIGATNVARTLGKTAGIVVFILDVLKGFAPSIAAYFIFGHSQVYAFGVGLAAIAGHCLSPFLGFRGGKAVATSLGVLFGSCPLVGACAFGVWLVLMVVPASRYVSLASIVAAISMVPFALLFHVDQAVVYALCALSLFVIYRHRPNIQRLKNGTEPKFRFGASKEPERPTDSSQGPALMAAPPRT